MPSPKIKPKTNFALPPPVPYDPPSAILRYRGLLILFVVLFFVAIVLARHLIQVQRDRPLPLEPVYLEHFEEKPLAPDPKPPEASAAQPSAGDAGRVKRAHASKKAAPAAAAPRGEPASAPILE